MRRSALLVVTVFLTLGAGCRAAVRQPEPAPVPEAARQTVPAPAAYRADLDPAVRAWVDRTLPSWVRRYEDLHAHPELSLAEHGTAAMVAVELGRAGYRVTTGVGARVSSPCSRTVPVPSCSCAATWTRFP